MEARVHEMTLAVDGTRLRENIYWKELPSYSDTRPLWNCHVTLRVTTVSLRNIFTICPNGHFVDMFLYFEEFRIHQSRVARQQKSSSLTREEIGRWRCRRKRKRFEQIPSCETNVRAGSVIKK